MYYNRELSSREKHWLAKASKLAELSTCNNKHGAIIFKGSRVLGVGVNRFKNHPAIVSSPSLESSVHAEIAAIKALGSETKGATIVIARVNNKGEQMMSHPCDSCMKEIQKVGIKRVLYTIDKRIDFNER